MRNALILILFFIAATACNKVVTPNVTFDVSTTANTYKVGDTVTFNFSGNPNYLVFYSGEFGNEYQFVKRAYLTGGTTNISFSSTVTGEILPDTLLKILLSPDFTGVNSKTVIANSTWIDITNRFTLSDGTAEMPSGVANISDLITADSVPLTIAFHYSIPAKRKTNWTIQNLAIKTVLQDGYSVPVYNSASGFTAVDSLNSSIKWNISTTALSTSGSSATSAASDDWVISKPFFPYRTTMDQGTAIKSIEDVAISNYQYVFNTAGKYTVTFVAQNANVYNTKVVVKTINLTITP